MPNDGDKLNELISGLLDGVLDEHERSEAEAALASSTEAQQLLEAFRANRARLAETAERQPFQLSSDFTARVVAAAQAEKHALSNKPSQAEDHQSEDQLARDRMGVGSQFGSSQLGRSVRPASPEKLRMSAGRVAAVLAGLAATVLLIINLVPNDDGGVDLLGGAIKDSNTSASSNNVASNASAKTSADDDAITGRVLAGDKSVVGNALTENSQFAASDSADSPTTSSTSSISGANSSPLDAGSSSTSVQYVSELKWTISMVMVLHVTPTSDAYEAGIVEQYMSDAGVPPVVPILADSEVETALQDSEMIVTDAPQRKSAVYFIRADSTVIDGLFQRIWADTEHFTKANYNVALEDPQSRLFEKLARSTGTRFTVNQSFAAPVARLSSGEPQAKLPLFRSQERLVAKQRQPNDLPPATVPVAAMSGEMSNVLLLVELP